jgi:hypothetical protein
MTIPNEIGKVSDEHTATYLFPFNKMNCRVV